MDRVIRFYITERCNASCPSCFNASFRQPKDMEYDKFVSLCEYFKDNGVTLLKMMGGEPTVHPDFNRFFETAQHYFPKVCLFTNGLSPKILSINPRDEDTIIYNSLFIRKIPTEHFLFSKDGIRGIEMQVSSKRAIDDFNYLENKLGRLIYRIIVNLTLDCSSNIFKNKDTIIHYYTEIWNLCKAKHIKVAQDHVVPHCFSIGTDFPRTQIYAKCDFHRAGVIDAHYNLRYCNQYPQVLTNMFSDGRIIPFEVFQNYIKYEYMRTQIKVLNKICNECVFYDKYCNGGCFVGQSTISSDDILNSTNFPTI